MKKILLVVLVLINLYSSEKSMRYGYSDLHAYLMQKNSAQVWIEYDKLNDALDVFNIKKQELGSNAKSFGSIGDLDGVSLGIRYRGNSSRMYTLSSSFKNIKYGENSLKNKNIEIFARQNLYTNPFVNFNAVSFDIGLHADKATDISYSKPIFLENLAKKVFDVKDVKIAQISGKYKIGIVKKDGSTLVTDSMNQKPTLYIKDMADASIYIRLIAEKHFSDNFLTGMFLKTGWTKITSKVGANQELIQEASKKGYETQKNLDRDEKYIEAGFNTSFYTGSIVLEMFYRYMYLFRDSSLDYINYNHIVEAFIEKPIGKSYMVYIGGKFMYRQFNGVIPYLYNKYTQTTFDHKYGYAKFGIIYNF